MKTFLQIKVQSQNSKGVTPNKGANETDGPSALQSFFFDLELGVCVGQTEDRQTVSKRLMPLWTGHKHKGRLHAHAFICF